MRHRQLVQEFANACGHLTVGELKLIHVTNWLSKKKTWGPTTRNRVIGDVKQVFNWAVDQGLIANNPVRSLKKPPLNRRERILSPVERAKIFVSVKDQAFRDFLVALEQTGARPGEIRQVTAANVDLENGIWVLQKHKTSKQAGGPRVIFLTPTMQEMTERLVARFPTGPIFRNFYGEPWSANAIRIRFRRLRKQFPELAGVVAYFTSDPLLRSVRYQMGQCKNASGVSSCSSTISHKSCIS
jgi:integrase